MSVQQQERKPPFVKFSYEPVEDRVASEAEGRPIFLDVAFATITPAGSKDNVIRPVEEWFKMLRKEVQQERFPAEWLRHYEEAFAYFKKGEEMPLTGTPIKTWPAVTPSQAKTLIEMHILTAETLAEANEETIMRLGMGGRALAQKAKDFMASANDHGKVVAELETVRRDLSEAVQSRDEMAKQLAELQGTVKTLQEMMEKKDTTSAAVKSK